jgi:hypothetical protein
MAQLVRTFAVTTPAGTLASAPLVTSLAMPARLVRTLRIRVPPGPAGQLGIALVSGGQQMLPEAAGTYLVMDDEAVEWPLDGQLETGAWQLRSYNTGRWDHTVYLTFLLDPLPARGGSPVGPLPLNLEV